MKRPFILFILAMFIFSCQRVEDQKNMDMVLLDAVKKNDVITVKKLLKGNINVEARDENNRTLLLIATYNDNLEIAQLLLNAGANVNSQDNIKDSPFLYAGAQGKLELVRLFLNYNPNFNLYNRFGGTALIPAAEKGHPEVVKLLANIPDYPINHVNNLGWTALMEAIVLGSGGSVHTSIVQELVDAGVDINITDSDGVSALTHAKNRGFTDIVKILESVNNK